MRRQPDPALCVIGASTQPISLTAPEIGLASIGAVAFMPRVGIELQSPASAGNVALTERHNVGYADRNEPSAIGTPPPSGFAPALNLRKTMTDPPTEFAAHPARLIPNLMRGESERPAVITSGQATDHDGVPPCERIRA